MDLSNETHSLRLKHKQDIRRHMWQKLETITALKHTPSNQQATRACHNPAAKNITFHSVMRQIPNSHVFIEKTQNQTVTIMAPNITTGDIYIQIQKLPKRIRRHLNIKLYKPQKIIAAR